MKRSSIDIGSNSILLLIAEVSDNKLEIIFRDQKVTSLGKDLDKNKVFCQESMDDSFDALKEYSQIIKKYNLNLEQTIVTATEASRVAKNSAEFFKKVKQEIGLNITTITGRGEAYYSALGACLDVDKKLKNITIMDIGGASTEIVKVNLDPFELGKFVSLPLGSVRVTNWREEKILNQKLEEIKDKNKEIINVLKTEKLLCVAGTMTSIANMHQELKSFEEDKVHNYQMNSVQLKKLKEELVNYTVDDFLKRYPFLQKRAKSIWGGMEVANFVINLLGVNEVNISTYGLMFGTALEGEIKDEFIFR